MEKEKLTEEDVAKLKGGEERIALFLFIFLAIIAGVIVLVFFRRESANLLLSVISLSVAAVITAIVLGYYIISYDRDLKESIKLVYRGKLERKELRRTHYSVFYHLVIEGEKFDIDDKSPLYEVAESLDEGDTVAVKIAHHTRRVLQLEKE